MSYYKTHDAYDPTRHRHFIIKVVDVDDDFLQYDVLGHDSLTSEASVYTSCISYPHDNTIMIRHEDGISLFQSFHHVEIFVQREPTA